MRGMDEITGKPLDGLAHLQQSVRDILLTAAETRVLRREYGCGLARLVDAPLSAPFLLAFYAAVAAALAKYEPRLRLQSLSGAPTTEGHLSISLVGVYKHNGEEILLEGIEL